MLGAIHCFDPGVLRGVRLSTVMLDDASVVIAAIIRSMVFIGRLDAIVLSSVSVMMMLMETDVGMAVKVVPPHVRTPRPPHTYLRRQ
jgi:hypothetical protein